MLSWVGKRQLTSVKAYLAQLVDALSDKPIFTAADIAQRASVPKPTAHKLINSLLEECMLATVRAAAWRFNVCRRGTSSTRLNMVNQL